MMTSFAFILGVVPLAVAVGAGAEMRRTLGMAVFAGMLGVTLFGIFLTPVFFYVIHGLGQTKTMSSPGMRTFSWVALERPLARPSHAPGPDAGAVPAGARHEHRC